MHVVISVVKGNDIVEQLGEILKEYRSKKSLTQTEAAQKLGISRTYLSQMENGTANNPSFSLAVRILNLWKAHGTIEVTLPRRVMIDAAIAPEIVWLNSQEVVTVACCAEPPPTAMILPSSKRRAYDLGYNPQYRSELGLFEIALKTHI